MAKLRVMSAGAMEGPVHALTPEFERASGHQVELIFNTVGALRTRFVGGDSPDVIILSSQVIEALEKEWKKRFNLPYCKAHYNGTSAITAGSSPAMKSSGPLSMRNCRAAPRSMWRRAIIST